MAKALLAAAAVVGAVCAADYAFVNVGGLTWAATPGASAVALDLFVVFLVAVVAPLGVMLCQSRRASKRAVAFGLLAAAFAYIAVFEHARSRERFVARTSAVMEMRRARGLGQKATEKATVDVGSEEEEAAEPPSARFS